MSKTLATTLLSGVILLISAAHASAATTLGQTGVPLFAGCASGNTWVQGVDPSTGASYHAPSAGVITSWSYQADSSVNERLRFKVAQPLGGNNYAVRAESILETVQPNVLNTYGTRLPIQAGDTIGYYNPDGAACAIAAPSTAVIHLSPGDTNPGDPWGGAATDSGLKLNVSAQLEADADGDGFGDESQDLCPTNAATQGTCPSAGGDDPPETDPPDTDPPETEIVKGPKRRTEEHKATFIFVSDEANSTFECRLKGDALNPSVKAFNPCTSPKTYKKLGEGEYRFEVFAIDPLGNRDIKTGLRFRIIGER